MIQTVFNILATLLFMWLGHIWLKSTAYNTVLKFTFILMAVYGLFVCLKDFGFIMKI